MTERIPALAFLAAILVFSLAFLVFGRFKLMQSEYRAVEQGLATLTTDTFGEPVTDATLVTQRLARSQGLPAYMRDISAADVVTFVGGAFQKTLSELHPVTLTSLDIDMQRGTARIGGVCDTAEATDALQAHLIAARCLTDVDRTSLNERRGETGYEFGFQAAVRCASATDETTQTEVASNE